MKCAVNRYAVNLRFWIMVRTNAEFYSKDEELDVWAIWADFRSACENFTSAKIVVGFIVTGDLGDEFVVPDLYNRWKGEPVRRTPMPTGYTSGFSCPSSG